MAEPGARRTMRRAMSRRSAIAVIVMLLLAAAYVAATTGVRWHVDGLIQHAVGGPLPAFRLLDRAGKTWTADDLRGKRVVLHCFRSGCEACEAEAPELRALEANLPADVVLLHVFFDPVRKVDAQTSAATLAAKAFARPVLLADSPFVDAFHGVKWSNVTPVTYVVDAQGVVRYGLRGKQTRAAIEAALAAIR